MAKRTSSKSYSSFGELRMMFGLAPLSHPDEDIRKNKQFNFRNRHICKGCNKPMSYLKGISAMTCTNPNCKGVKVRSRSKNEGNGKFMYLPSYDLLDEIGFDIAQNIFE